MIVIRVDIYEKKSYPVVRHEFRGETREEAERYLNAHRVTDKFMDNCLRSGTFERITCNTKISEFME